MFVVNFLGGFRVTPAILRHNDTFFSYADSIMPHFFFAVGFAYRLTFLRGLAKGEASSVRAHVWRRNLKLILLGAVVYLVPTLLSAVTGDRPKAWGPFFGQLFKEELFQTLVHIGITALWILPVIGASTRARLLFALGSGTLHLGLSHWFYYDWVTKVAGIDGGMLGFLTWSIPMIAGTLAHDLWARRPEPGASIGPLLQWGIGLMALGYGLSCLNLLTPPNSAPQAGFASWLVEPPFTAPTHPVNLWTMSQRAGSVTYLTFGAGFSLALYAGFVWACDLRGFQVGVLRTLGSNPLAGYLLHILIGVGFSLLLPSKAPWSVVMPALWVYLAVCYGAVRFLEWRKIYWRM